MIYLFTFLLTARDIFRTSTCWTIATAFVYLRYGSMVSMEIVNI